MHNKYNYLANDVWIKNKYFNEFLDKFYKLNKTMHKKHKFLSSFKIVVLPFNLCLLVYILITFNS